MGVKLSGLQLSLIDRDLEISFLNTFVANSNRVNGDLVPQVLFFIIIYFLFFSSFHFLNMRSAAL